MEIQGEIAVGEASRFAGKATARLNGHPMTMIISKVVSGGAAIVLILAFSALQTALELPAWSWAPAFLAVLWLSISLGLKACRWWALRFARKAFADRGLVNPVPSRFALTDDGFASGTGRATLVAPWSAVSDLLSVGPYWVLLVEGHPQFLPKRFFASPVEEHAFVRALLERMLPEARVRSVEAENLIKG